jgi:hypothetical protein
MRSRLLIETMMAGPVVSGEHRGTPGGCAEYALKFHSPRPPSIASIRGARPPPGRRGTWRRSATTPPDCCPAPGHLGGGRPGVEPRRHGGVSQVIGPAGQRDAASAAVSACTRALRHTRQYVLSASSPPRTPRNSRPSGVVPCSVRCARSNEPLPTWRPGMSTDYGSFCRRAVGDARDGRCCSRHPSPAYRGA